MNINRKIRNKRKLAENLRGYTKKYPICLLFTRLDYKTWHQIKVEIVPFNQNY